MVLLCRVLFGRFCHLTFQEPLVGILDRLHLTGLVGFFFLSLLWLSFSSHCSRVVNEAFGKSEEFICIHRVDIIHPVEGRHIGLNQVLVEPESEERRVGKECRSGWATAQYEKNAETGSVEDGGCRRPEW